MKCIAGRGPQIRLSTKEEWKRGAENVGGRNVHVEAFRKAPRPRLPDFPIKPREPGLKEGLEFAKCISEFRPPSPGEGARIRG